MQNYISVGSFIGLLERHCPLNIANDTKAYLSSEFE